jgi:cobalt/nickel transport protein|uniref:PDGLE domain-containing protein n=1 Tax=Candidatus Planktophila sp. TaxID=2175601 RepID=UPI00404ACE48
MKNPLVVVGLVLSLVLAGGLSYYASSEPDGFEKSAGEIGFLDTAEDSPLADSPLADYGVAGVENERLSGGLAGVIGVASTAAISFGIFYTLRRFNKSRS